MSHKIFNTLGRAVAGLAAVSLLAAVATPASAQSRYRYDHHRGGRGGDVAAAALVAGVVGLAVGSSINNHDRYDRGYYDNRGYAPPPPPRAYGYGYGYGYEPRGYYRGGRDCWTTREFDRYRGEVYERTVCR